MTTCDHWLEVFGDQADRLCHTRPVFSLGLGLAFFANVGR